MSERRVALIGPVLTVKNILKLTISEITSDIVHIGLKWSNSNNNLL